MGEFYLFTFHYVSIKTHLRLYLLFHQNYLHSTMYLLKPKESEISPHFAIYLHSTMYLLKLPPLSVPVSYTVSFTFHYVSIKTLKQFRTSFLAHLFTFHYVSIKTMLKLNLLEVLEYLHSTMYLLKPVYLQLSFFKHSKYTFCQPSIIMII